MANEKTLSCWQYASLVFTHRDLFPVSYLYGGAGIGKTFTAMREGVGDSGAYSVTLTPETPAAEVRGHYIPKGGEFVWQDGPVLKAVRAGARLVINEVSHASSDVLAFFYPLLESRATSAIPLPTGEQVTPAPGFQVVMTDNFPPDQLPPALRDRMDCVVHIDSFHPDALAMLKPEYRDVAIQLGGENVDPERRVSLRGWLRVQAAEQRLGQEVAFGLVFGRERGAMLRDAIAIAGGK